MLYILWTMTDDSQAHCKNLMVELKVMVKTAWSMYAYVHTNVYIHTEVLALVAQGKKCANE